jgi:hypothetical protein
VPQVLATGTYTPGRPSNDHARGFERAVEAALIALSASSLNPQQVEIVFRADVTKRNPVDIDGYIAIIQTVDAPV